MSRNSSGVYTLPVGNPVASGTTIEASWANSTLNDVATSLTNSLDRTGKGGMQAPLLLADGSVSAPTLAFVLEPSSGWYRAGTNDLRMAVNGAQVLKQTSSLATFATNVEVPDLEVTGTLTATISVSWGDVTGTPTTLAGYGITDAATSAQGALADTASQPGDNVSDFVNDAGYITSVGSISFADLTGKPTTISGYGITDAVTLTTAQTLTNKTITGIIETVDTLPTSGTIPLVDSDGTLVFLNATGSVTFTDSLNNGESITLMLRQSTGTITWPTLEWMNNGNAAPTVVPTLYTAVVLWKMGSTIYGAVIGTQA